MKNTRGLTGSQFLALPHEEKNRILAEIEAESPEARFARSKPLNAKERTEWRLIQKRLRRGPGRPRVGDGVLKISVSIERSLMDRADAYAKKHGLKRSELFASSVAKLIGA